MADSPDTPRRSRRKAAPQPSAPPISDDAEILISSQSVVPITPTVLPDDLVRASDLDPVVQDWLLDQIIPAGVFALVTGAPGGSKTSWLIDFAAKASKGTLDGDHKGKPMNVLFLSREDSATKTLVPKLMAADAWGETKAPGDGDVILLSPKREDSYAFPRDVNKLAQLIKQHAVGLVILDSLMSFMDTQRSLHGNYQAAVESVTPLAEMCVKAGVTLMGVMHLKKDADTAGLNSIIGSIGISATARHVVMIGTVPLSEHRIVGVVKSNLGGEGVGQVYDVTWPIVGLVDGDRIRASRIDPLRPATEDEVYSMLEKRQKQNNSARDLLILATIRDGADYTASEVLRKAPEINVVQRTMRRVLQSLDNKGLVLETPGTPGVVGADAARFTITQRGLDMVNALSPEVAGEPATEEGDDEPQPRKVINILDHKKAAKEDSA
jgi:hypothetical protein